MKSFLKKFSRIAAGFIAITLALGLFPNNAISAKTSGLKLNNTKLTAYVDSEIVLEIVDSKTGETDWTATGNAEWSSSDENVVITEKCGYFWAYKKGKATLTAVYEGKKYTCKVTVKEKKNSTKKDNSGSGNTNTTNGPDRILEILTGDELEKFKITMQEMCGLTEDEAAYLVDYTLACVAAGGSWDDLDKNVQATLEYFGITADMLGGTSGGNNDNGNKDNGKDNGNGNTKKGKTIADYTGAKYLYEGKTGNIVLEYEGKNLYRFLKFDTTGDLEWNCDWQMNRLKGSERKVQINNKTYTFDYVLYYPMEWYPEGYEYNMVYLRVTSKTFKLVMADYNQKKNKYKLYTQTYSRVDTAKSKTK